MASKILKIYPIPIIENSKMKWRGLESIVE